MNLQQSLAETDEGEAWQAAGSADAVRKQDESEAVNNLPMQANWRKQRMSSLGQDWAEYVRGGEWLNRWNWERANWLERAAGWSLNEKEKLTAQFMLGGRAPNWSSRWRVAVIATACAFTVLLARNELFRVGAFLSTAVSVGAGVPVLGGVWPAMQQGIVSGKFAPLHACYPLDYWRAGWTMWKVNTVRTLAWAPVGLLLGILLGYDAQMGLGASTLLAGRIILLYIALSPIMVAGKFSKSTNDTVNLRWSRILAILVLVLLIIVLLVGGGVALAIEGLPGVGLTALLGVLTVGSWALYGWYWGRREVDLLTERQS